MCFEPLHVCVSACQFACFDPCFHCSLLCAAYMPVLLSSVAAVLLATWPSGPLASSYITCLSAGMLNGAKSAASDACLYSEDTITRLLNETLAEDNRQQVQLAAVALWLCGNFGHYRLSFVLCAPLSYRAAQCACPTTTKCTPLLEGST